MSRAARGARDRRYQAGPFVGDGRVVLADLIGQPVRITWTDAEGSCGWKARKAIKHEKLPVIRTIGLLVHVSDDAVHVAGDHNTTNGTYNQCGLIPLGWVRSVEALASTL